MSEIEKAIAILADKAICEFCEDCGNDEVCIKCKTVYPVTAEELRMFYKVAGQSLLEKRERENPQPLGLEELEKLFDEPVWVDTGEMLIDEQIVGCYEILERVTQEPVKVFWFTRRVRGFLAQDYGKTWLVYRYEPEHIGEATNMIEGE